VKHDIDINLFPTSTNQPAALVWLTPLDS